MNIILDILILLLVNLKALLLTLLYFYVQFYKVEYSELGMMYI